MAVLAHEGTHPIMYGAAPLPIGAGLRTGYLARPDAAGKFPVVLVLPTLDGLTGFEKDLCRMFARWGVAAIGIDFYRHPGNHLEAYHELSDTRAMTDLDEVHEFVASNDVDWAVSGDVGILGLDVGGRFAIAAAATRPWVKSLAVAYTPLTGDEDRGFQVASYLDNLPVPVLGLYGAEDALIDAGTIDEAQRRNEHGLWLLYEGAGHGFLDVDADLYDADSAEEAVQRLIEFFKANLPQPEELDLG
ncbi:MAG TPA: dienelactone hydrolase family protein [Acidimicrobiia bacterium]|nr:dienelactone hydrolase family protein [Acidimicrobiia bacterium]